MFSEQRTDQIGPLYVNKLMGGGDGGGGGGTMFLNTGSNVQNVNKQTIITPIVDQDPVIRQVGRSINGVNGGFNEGTRTLNLLITNQLDSTY